MAQPPLHMIVYCCMMVIVFVNLTAGYEMFGPMRSDRALCFRSLCGEEPRASSKKKKAAIVRAAALAAKTRAAQGVESDVSGGDSEWEEGIEEPPPGKKTPRAIKHASKFGKSCDPMLLVVKC